MRKEKEGGFAAFFFILRAAGFGPAAQRAGGRPDAGSTVVKSQKRIRHA
jgi:hypothetical protein